MTLLQASTATATLMALFCATSVQAQVMTCSASGIPPLLRAGGLAELVGDVVVVCTGGVATAAGAAIPAVDIQVSFNAPVTSRLLASPWAEALLLLDEPGVGANPAQAVCQNASGVCVNVGNGIGNAPNYYIGQGTGSNVNVFQGKLAGTNSIVFPSVPIDPPGASGSRVIRIVNVRVAAAALGVPAPGSLISVIALVSIPGAPVSNPTPVVGLLQPDAQVTYASPAVFQQCVSQNSALASNPGATGLAQTGLGYGELIATGFKSRTVAAFVDLTTSPVPADQKTPGFPYNSETGFFNSVFPDLGARGNLALAGLGDNATRLILRIDSIPAGVKLFSSVAPNPADAATVVRMISTDPNGAGAFLPTEPSGSGLAPIPTSNTGSALVVFEVLKSSPFALEGIQIPIYVAYDAVGGVPALGTATARGSLGPLSAVAAAGNASVPVPRFADSSSAFNLFSITAATCPAATNVTTLVTTKSRGHWEQTVTIGNSGANPIAGPVSLVLDGTDAVLLNQSGLTSAAAPAGAPYINVSIGGDNVLSPGEEATVLLQFQKNSGPLKYSARVLAGSAPR